MHARTQRDGSHGAFLATASVLLAVVLFHAAHADVVALSPATDPLPDDAELEAQGARIGSITIHDLPIFDSSVAGENRFLYRLADRLHVDTRATVIESQLLFTPGDRYSRQRLAETERNLRQLSFLREPEVRVTGYRNGLVDVEVIAHEVWTTNPGVSFGRSGGTNKIGIQLEELNLLGHGKHLAFGYSDDVDRSSYTIRWRDPSVWGSRWRAEVSLRDSDDGEGQWISVERPFYSLDTRWSAGFTVQRDDTIEDVYRLGDAVSAYGRSVDNADVRWGWSGGLRDGWTRRLTAGLRREHASFFAVADETAPERLPEARLLDYPWLRFEAIQDDFDTARNRDLIARTEDVHYGARYALEIGWAGKVLGSDRDAFLVSAEAARGFRLGDRQSLLLDGRLSGRLEPGGARDTLLSAGLRYYRPDGPRRTLYAALTTDVGHRLDADRELTLGGDNGLRGYPLRYQAGQGRTLLTVEQRFYTKYSLLHLADVGGAVFMDVGKTWGESAFGPTDNRGLLKDIGFGLRLGSTRTALGNMLHLDVAFPLDGPRSISRAQFLVQTRHGF